MSDINNTDDIHFKLQSGRFEILSENNEYKPFKGLVTGKVNKLYKYNNQYYTPGHEVKIGDGYKRIDELTEDFIEVNNKTVYDVFDVEDYHSYVSNDSINKNCLILN